jgi:hypothetical protein
MRFSDVLGRLLGRASKQVPPPKSDLEQLSRVLTAGPPAETYGPGPRLTGITSDDIDKDTGRIYPDYMARRATRAASEAGRTCAIGDVRPENSD